VDVWDGENGGEPVVYHGHTLTSKILFRDAIKAIKESAFTFVSSQYPVILSLETHCGVEGQRKMGNILKSILGGSYYGYLNVYLDRIHTYKLIGGF
jgi:phosphatidylinositol phospholipase C delta